MSPRSRSTKLSQIGSPVESVPVVKRPRGRPRIHPLPTEQPKSNGKYTPEIVVSICTGLEQGNFRRAVAAMNGINKDTITEWMNIYPDFSVQVRKAEAKAEYHCVIAIMTRASNWMAAAWWLERKYHEDWGRHDRIDMVVETRKEAEAVLQEVGLPADKEAVDRLVAEAERWATKQG